MLTRRYGVALGIAIALIILVPVTAKSAPGSEAGAETTGDASRAWLTLDWTGGPPTGYGEHLTVYGNGKVRLLLESPRANGYIGTFQSELSPRRLAALRKAVEQADLYGLRDTYPPRAGSYDYTTIRISVVTERGPKQVEISSSSSRYPEQLKALFDLTDGLVEGGNYYPGGVMSRLISEVSAKPLAAVSARVEVPKRSYRVADGIDVAVVVKNVSREVVVLPSTESRAIVYGSVFVKLHQPELPPEKIASGWDWTDVKFGPRLLGWHGALDDEAKSDLRHAVRLQPGAEWRVPMPKPLHAPSPGKYELVGGFRIIRLYARDALTREVGDGFVSGWMSPQSVEITVSK